MKEWKVFAEIIELKNKGFKKSQVERIMGINYKTIMKYWDMTPEEYAELMKKAKSRTKKVDMYKKDVLEWIREFDDISTAQIYDWLQEKYGMLDFKERTLRWYVNKLRANHNLPKAAYKRQYIEVPELPMGYQAQVDFGQTWQHKPDGSRIKLYCFAMVLSHSRFKFVHWLDKPFTTESFIEAHDRAFEYFKGMPKEIVYDQDRVLAVDENFGDVIYTQDFQNYINIMRFKTRLCRAYDPESKGKIEAVVKFVKYNFAIHRTFVDIDSFNEDCLKWLERTGNGKLHDITKKVPAEVFALESQHLQQVPQSIRKKSDDTSLNYAVRKNNTVFYKQNRYQVPKGIYEPGKQVKLVIKDTSMDIVDLESGEIIAHHALSNKKGELVKLNHPERQISKTTEEMYGKALNVLGDTEIARVLLDNIKRERSRYIKDQLGVIVKAAPNYDFDIIEKAVEYCVRRRLWSAGMFKDTLEHLNLKTSQGKNNKPNLNNATIPSKCKGVKTEVRAISEYTNALKGDKITWKN
ncbi:IS21 family transposase [Clostridium manihotivorum]|uniref:IS21 family transposase n=1 Tax=Clostridium manihotivorum TaxID=2320868 RepID=UPI001EE549DE|nr:IS21 family transposase [Clostridium manihotivorum]